MSHKKPIPKYMDISYLEGRYRIDKNGCWIWLLAKAANGYGICYVCRNGHTKVYKAHRISFQAHGNTLIPELEIDHLCRVRACINPKHLRQVPHRVNALAGISPWAENAKKTHCPKGHEYTKENTYFNRFVSERSCRTCGRIKDRKRYKKMAEERGSL